jgi:AraC-like DNA-binding protein
MRIEQLVSKAQHLARLADEPSGCASLMEEKKRSHLPGLVVMCRTHPGQVEAPICGPVFGLVLQGSTEISAGMQSLSIASGDLLVVSHDLPVATRVTHAAPFAPYLAVLISVDLTIIRSLAEQIGEDWGENKHAQTLEAGSAEPALIEAVDRYLSLPENSVEANVIIPLIRREVHFRVLVGRHGGMLRNLLLPGSHASKIAKAIALIQDGARERLSLSSLASAVEMGLSSFHHHFRSIAGTSPLQYQKDIRMIEAKRLLSLGGRTVTSVALEVGYESASQFSREYSRKFGAPPRNDLPRTGRAKGRAAGGRTLDL